MLEEQLIRIFPVHLREAIRQADICQQRLEEIRIRVGQPLMLLDGEGEWFLQVQTKRLVQDMREGYSMTRADLEEMVGFLCSYSMYAFEEQLRQGFLTLPGGHRMGVAGRGHIYFLNLRIAHEQKGCALELLRKLRTGESIYNTLLVSPPGVGKTTYLRDAIRLRSAGDAEHRGLRVGVVDERLELGAGYLGIPGNDLGPRTDVLEAVSKPEGIFWLLRSMSPQVIAVDELGAAEDFRAVTRAFYSGCRLIGTIHGDSPRSVRELQSFREWSLKDQIGRFVFLKKYPDGGRRMEIYDRQFQKLEDMPCG
jgi:stage III sporulation protein AA